MLYFPRTHSRVLIAFALPFFLGATCGPKLDSSPFTAVEAGDLTVPISGCGSDLHVGLTHTRTHLGAVPDCLYRVWVPEGLECRSESCADILVIRQDGSIHPLGSIKKGDSSFPFLLSAVVGDEAPIQRSQSGPYRVIVDAVFWDGDRDVAVQGRGIIYLSVLTPGYVSLACGSRDVAWRQEAEGLELHYSTKFRVAPCPLED